MIIVREVFTCKPGMASKLAKLMKEVMSPTDGKVRIMTDVAGPFNTVVMESEMADLATFEKRMAEYRADHDAMKQKMAGYTDMYLTGVREIYQTVE